MGSFYSHCVTDFCNAPHLSADHYNRPDDPTAQLVYVTSFQRHAKRTPDNLVPRNEHLFNPDGWDCSSLDIWSSARTHPSSGGGDGVVDAAAVNTQTDIPPCHPMAQRLWSGSCAAGQLTAGGLEDALQHGKDFWSVYGPDGPASLLSEVTADEVTVRTSPSARTAQVAGAFLHGMGFRSKGAFPIHIQPEALDGIVPSYSCSYGSKLRSAIENNDEWKEHLKNHTGVFEALNDVFETTRHQSSWNSWIDHSFDTLTARTCHDHPLPNNPINGRRVDWPLALKVFEMGDWEYNYIWNRAEQSNEYVKYQAAVLVDELQRDLVDVRQRLSGAVGAFDGIYHEVRHQREVGGTRMKLFIGHDGTIVRLLKTLAQSGQIRWPALGSEIVFEIWRSRAAEATGLYARIFSYGRLLKTDESLLSGSEAMAAEAGWTPLDKVIAYLESRVPKDLAKRCDDQ